MLQCHFIIIHRDLQIVVGCKQCFSIFFMLTSIFNMSHTKTISTSYSTKLHLTWMTTFGTFRLQVSYAHAHCGNMTSWFTNLTHIGTIGSWWTCSNTNGAPLKILMKYSFKIVTYFLSTTLEIIFSSCFSLRGSNGVFPSSPNTLSTSFTTTNISSTLA